MAIIKCPGMNFKIDINRDIKNAFYNINDSRADYESYVFKNLFLPKDLLFILDDKFTKKEVRKILREYVKTIYFVDEKEIIRGFDDAVRQWKKCAEKYFKLIDIIFKGYPWPQQMYLGFVSIFNSFNVWGKENEFSFPYKKNEVFNAGRVIGHEMLHLIYFSYIKARYGIGKNDGIRGKDEKYVWTVGETFVAVIESWPPYMKIFGIKEPVIYNGLEKTYAKMLKQWKRTQDIDLLLDQWFDLH